jgi:hypothetical protein
MEMEELNQTVTTFIRKRRRVVDNVLTENMKQLNQGEWLCVLVLLRIMVDLS